MQGGNRQPFIYDGERIRKLTPIECERLQGFPDNWTGQLSDTQRYKTNGNAVTVPVVTHITSELFRGRVRTNPQPQPLIMGSDPVHHQPNQRKETQCNI